MPRSDEPGRRLIASALPLKALRAVAPDRPILNVTYERGIGLDGAPPPQVMARTIAEAAALGVVPVIKGSEYLDERRRFTVLTAPALAAPRAAMTPLFAWLRASEPLFADLGPDPNVVVLYDDVAIAADFTALSAATFGVAAALLHEGVAFTFATRERLADFPNVPVLVPPGVVPPGGAGARVIVVEPALLAPLRLGAGVMRSRPLRALADPLLRGFSRSYFSSAFVRRSVDASGMTARFLRSRYFTLPDDTARIAALAGTPCTPRPEAPALVEAWRRLNGARVVHIVNYGDATIRVRFPDDITDWRLHTPNAGTTVNRDERVLWLERYAVLESSPATPDD